MSELSENSDLNIDNDLKDLTSEDAEELKAFSEKRRWFESKLKVLTSLPSVYPFLHPVLEHDGSDVIRQGASTSSWQLPSEIEVRQAQQDRDVLEDEILAFDGGELARIRAKVRALTSVPLAPPSTHIVSVALDLVVLADRLLKLLRQRRDLLHLTALRLRWDKLRGHIRLECESIVAEIGTVVGEAGRWRPTISTSARHRTRNSLDQPFRNTPSLISVVATETPQTPKRIVSSSIASTPDHVQRSSDSSGMKTPLVKPTSRHSIGTSSPSSLKRSLLHTKLSNLHIRYDQLQSMFVSPGSKALDDMVDLAPHLKGLGDTRGPNDIKTPGSVPDQLLDIQDELDSRVQDVSGRISWCEELERQWERADSYHQAVSGAAELATDLFHDILQVRQGEIEYDASRLQSRLSEAEAALPKEVDDTFPTPSHSAYPSHTEYNVWLCQFLSSARRDAAKQIADCSRLVKLLGQFTDANDSILTFTPKVESFVHQATRTLTLLRQGTSSIPRPSPDVAQLEQYGNQWFAAVPEWLEIAHMFELADPVCDRLQLAVTKRQVAARGMSEMTQSLVTNPAELVNETAADVLNESSIVVEEVRNEARMVALDLEIMPLAVRCIEASKSIMIELLDVRTVVTEAIRASDQMNQQTDFGRRFQNTLDIPATQFFNCFDEVHALITNRGQIERFRPLETYLQNMRSRTQQEIRSTHDLVVSWKAVRDQAKVVRDIEQESVEWVARVQQSIDDTPTEENPDALKGMKESVTRWNTSLLERLPQLTVAHAAIEVSREPVEEMSPSLISKYSGAFRLTPPDTPPLSSEGSVPEVDIAEHLEHLDEEARVRVNEAQARVAAALHHALHPPPPPQDDSFESARRLDKSILKETQRQEKNRLISRLLALDLASIVMPPEVEDDVESLGVRLPDKDSLALIRDEVKAITVEVEDKLPADELFMELETARSQIARLDQLEEFTFSVEQADKIISEILVIIDMDLDHEVFLKQASAAMTKVEEASTELRDDLRVRFEIRRLRNTLKMIESIDKPTENESSETESSISTPPTVSPRSIQSTHSSMRAAFTPRSIFSPDAPRYRATSGSQIPHHLSRIPISTSPGPHANRLSHVSSHMRSFSSELPIISSTPRPLPVTPKRRYVSNPRSKLDVAVGKVVNKLKVHVPVVPVNQEIAPLEEGWETETGSYWIGAKGRARLCYCRILRSKMVMVRVGGGWCELSQFLQDHFSELTEPMPSPNLTTSARLGSPAPHTPLPSRSLSRSLSNSVASQLSPMHYLRKASDSPTVRDAQREQYARPSPSHNRRP
ncbi:hypothetical protein M231_03384 [Tremella mesenterica]|uniref:GAR domain-containing protein n=1 Tax=Tremella mesenterica TaxID=5217 RepID=A0A4Q1BN64_TREME|nr:hypothetical protein M231_03384 [Tremella mesenterica]